MKRKEPETIEKLIERTRKRDTAAIVISLIALGVALAAIVVRALLQ